MDREFDAKIGRFRGGLQLMAAFGFVDPSTAQVTSIASTRTPGKLTLRNTTAQSSAKSGAKDDSGLSVSYVTGLKGALQELKQHIESLEYPEMANNHAVASAMEYIGANARALTETRYSFFDIMTLYYRFLFILNHDELLIL